MTISAPLLCAYFDSSSCNRKSHFFAWAAQTRQSGVALTVDNFAAGHELLCSGHILSLDFWHKNSLITLRPQDLIIKTSMLFKKDDLEGLWGDHLPLRTSNNVSNRWSSIINYSKLLLA